MNVAFRVDAAPEIGSGHLRRCLCLADALRARGAHTRVVSRGLPPHLRALCDAGGHEVRELHEADGPGSGADIEPAAGGPAHARWLGTSQGADAAATRAVLAGASWDWLVVDHYGLDARWESALRPAAGRILAIDDLADRAHDCDVLLDQNLHVEPEARYAGKVPEASRLLLGPRFALLRPEFARARARVAERTGPVQRVLVAFGGADAANHTTAALQALAAAAGSTRPAVDVVVPAGHPHVAAIDAACRRDGFDCHVQSDRMADLMAAADVSVGAAGTMLWERCSVGLPALALAVAANQVAGLAAAARGGLVYAPDAGGDAAATIGRHLPALLQNAALRELISTRGMEAVDGRGVDRVIGRLGVDAIDIRAAAGSDAANLLAWRNHESVRRAAWQSAPIAPADHDTWLRSVLADPDRVLVIGERAGRPVGVVRFDIAAGSAEVSIHRVPDAAGPGLGGALLAAAEAWLLARRPDVGRFTASVRPENVRSHALFRAAGYRTAEVRYEKPVVRR